MKKLELEDAELKVVSDGGAVLFEFEGAAATASPSMRADARGADTTYPLLFFRFCLRGFGFAAADICPKWSEKRARKAGKPQHPHPPLQSDFWPLGGADGGCQKQAPPAERIRALFASDPQQ